MSWFGRGDAAALRETDLAYVDPVRGAQVVEAAPAAMWAVYLMLALLASALGWAAFASVDIVAKAPARVIPEGREQVIASLEGGILRELLVREGQQVEAGQPLALLDPTRFEAQQAEGQAKRAALRGQIARLAAETVGRAPKFDADLPKAVIDGESENFEARRQSLEDAVATHRRSIALLNRELAVADRMAGKGLMSEVEVMRVRRQVNDLELQVQERVNRFRQEANAELVKLRTELAQLEEQLVVRDDALRRTTLASPVRGVVKQIKNNTLGGIVAPGGVVMEVVPVGPRVLIEARIRPADIGFVEVGQRVEIKLSTYDYTVFGGLKGTVQSISPDAIGDPDRPGGAESLHYRALVRADNGAIQVGEGARARTLQVLPGMTGSAEIRTGQRTVLSYLLRPMLKSQEALRER